ncbi:single-stranded DNA-binding protein [Nocardia vulneris]|uniref:single-stranded DNA-binding protein n=1 Tax=Nocardia vulneris TaxID=1141657 RepID=UPI003BB215B1
MQIRNITHTPELVITPSGAAVTNFTVASTPRYFDRSTNEWKDGEALFMRCNVWRDQAEHVAETLTRGARVIGSGRLKATQLRNPRGRQAHRRRARGRSVAEVRERQGHQGQPAYGVERNRKHHSPGGGRRPVGDNGFARTRLRWVRRGRHTRLLTPSPRGAPGCAWRTTGSSSGQGCPAVRSSSPNEGYQNVGRRGRARARHHRIPRSVPTDSPVGHGNSVLHAQARSLPRRPPPWSRPPSGWPPGQPTIPRGSSRSHGAGSCPLVRREIR